MLEHDIFAFLDGASPWWWIALALALGAVEIVTLTYFMLWLGLASLTVGLALVFVPDLPGRTQVLSFGLLAIFYTGIGWMYLKRMQPRDEHTGLNRRSAAVVGRQGIVTGAFKADVGWIEVDGVRWRARLAEGAQAPESGAPVKIVSAEGMTVIVAEPG